MLSHAALNASVRRDAMARCSLRQGVIDPEHRAAAQSRKQTLNVGSRRRRVRTRLHAHRADGKMRDSATLLPVRAFARAQSVATLAPEVVNFRSDRAWRYVAPR